MKQHADTRRNVVHWTTEMSQQQQQQQQGRREELNCVNCTEARI